MRAILINLDGGVVRENLEVPSHQNQVRLAVAPNLSFSALQDKDSRVLLPARIREFWRLTVTRRGVAVFEEVP